jgi:hypothetical protein
MKIMLADKRYHRFLVGLALACLILVAGCQAHSPESSVADADPPEASVQEPQAKIRILVSPFVDSSAIYGAGNRVRCPYCGQSFETGPVEEEAAELLQDHLLELLKEKESYIVFPPGTARGEMSRIIAGNDVNLPERQLQIETAKSLGAQRVLISHVYRFRERIGGRLSAEQPASVAFGLHLLDVTTGEKIWEGHVDETQIPLSENLLNLRQFLNRKASWITADELAREGLEELFRTFPDS